MPANTGTKFAPHYVLEIETGQSQTVRLRLSAKEEAPVEAFAEFDNIFAQRRREADEFYDAVLPAGIRNRACSTFDYHTSDFRQLYDSEAGLSLMPHYSTVCRSLTKRR
jgi:hypothetical protein